MKRLLILIGLLFFITGCVSSTDRKYADELATDFIQNDLGLKNTKAKMNRILADEGGSVRMSILFSENDLKTAEEKYVTDITKDISKKKAKNRLEFKTTVVHDEEESLWLYSNLVEALNIRVSELFGNEFLTEVDSDLAESYRLTDKVQPFDFAEITDKVKELKRYNARMFIEPLEVAGYKTIAKDYEWLIYASTSEKLDWLTRYKEQFQIILIIESEHGIKGNIEESIKIDELKEYSNFSVKFSVENAE